MTRRVSSKNKEKKRPKGKIVLKRDQTEKKNGTKKKKTASPGVEHGLSAGAGNFLATAPQSHDHEKLILSHQNNFSLP